MEPLSSQLKGPKRQETLGPTSPIQDWEVERANLLIELNKSNEKANRLEKELKKYQETHERNTSSLLREVKLKESYMEKKLKEVEEQLMAELVELQYKLDEERHGQQKEIQNLKKQHELDLEAENKKYQRRLISLQERLSAKDKEYAELFDEKENLLQQNRSREIQDTDDDDEKSFKSESVKQKELQRLLLTNNSNNNNNTDKKKSTATEERDTLSNIENSIKESKNEIEVTDLHTYSKNIQEEKFQIDELLIKEFTEKEEKEYIEHIKGLEKELVLMQKELQAHKKRLEHTLSSHDAYIRELTEKFMLEAQRSEMTNQAQLQNLQSEHTEMMHEIREQHETEREVWQIQHTTLIDEMRRTLIFEKEDALSELNKEWKERIKDLKASMSKDSMQIQAHWEAKLNEVKSKSVSQISRLQGEMEVIKDRLGHEIQRRKRYQSNLDEVTEMNKLIDGKLRKYQSKYNELFKQRAIYEKETMMVTKLNITK
ncbi:uncharacterized protein BX663DRAFT_496212 [Cokeromyces recurvatus]|uniref:uncharacterized protein n=1 Tax=Cokeromyces recurvatus TaxID=90255 RepID=UPI00221E90D8|nr:uncharacterized protein BX663DRAFT_496212 [Cokeromyces recurvatus]KAI7906376.1 hypothetical protein BX663DRAFT_496212 [Cokeromyces recurvatus]